jgi:hypothetical protein
MLVRLGKTNIAFGPNLAAWRAEVIEAFASL